MRRLITLYALLLAYLSLYPFYFTAPVRPVEPVWSRSDMLANVLAFIPLGVLLRAWAERQFVNAARAMSWMLLAAVAFAALLQWLQVFVPGRSASLMDIGMNMIGVALGASLLVLAHWSGWSKYLLPLARQPEGWLLLFCLLHQLAPFIPLSPDKAWRLIVYQWTEMAFDPALLLAETLGWALLFRLVDPVSLLARRLAPLVLLLSAFVWANGLQPEELLGLLLAYGLYWGRQYWSLRWLLPLALGYWLWRTLLPWQWLDTRQPFYWLPFASLMHVPIAWAIQQSLAKLFWLAAMLYLGSLWPLVRRYWLLLLLVVLVLVETLQLFLPRHAAETTDAVLLLGLAFGWHQLERLSRQQTESVAPGFWQ